MFICTTEGNPWQKMEKSDRAGVELRVGEEMQRIRGFGTCFSELGALALEHIPTEERNAFLDELFDEDKCNFNYCRTPMGASDFATDFYSYNEADGDFEMKHFSIERDKRLLLPLVLEGVKRRARCRCLHLRGVRRFGSKHAERTATARLKWKSRIWRRMHSTLKGI